MFDRLVASLNTAFKWLPMFDLDQTFSSNILLHEHKMFDRLATSGNKANPSGEKKPIRYGICVTSLQNSTVIHREHYVGSLCSMFDRTLFACLATPCCVRQTRYWTKKFARLAGAYLPV